jgi:hypothetical protein
MNLLFYTIRSTDEDVTIEENRTIVTIERVFDACRGPSTLAGKPKAAVSMPLFVSCAGLVP